MACRKRHNSLESLRRFLVKAAAEILMETKRVATTGWPKHLKASIEAQGGHLE
jgi:hypothetical protein